MKNLNFTSFADVPDLQEWIKIAQNFKENPLSHESFGKGKTLGLLFFNPSLRTRLSTQKAAMNLGMNVMIMNVQQDGWTIEMEDGTVMNQNSQEHIKEAAGVISQYCDIIGVRTFASLADKKADYEEKVLQKFIKYALVPVISLESATAHPLQSFADILTIEEFKAKTNLTKKSKVVLSWSPHPKALPQAVPNSFVNWVKNTDSELVIACPKGFELNPEYTKGVSIVHNQEEAFKDADFIYAKNWSSFSDENEIYGKIGQNLEHWIVDEAKMKLTNNAKFMHCLPVRRNVVVADEVIDSQNSVVLEQAHNRVYSAQTVLFNILEQKFGYPMPY
ncbi:ornithine carbamoyltransferase [Bernardetia litoralis DSM 6794]|uniref:N-succinylornithine carbamoyltransferase n=1 Tax=Bernardetia litoralis (strain ATCC 23117 / DSM 6794 / NBRC 15988 / NCIMB 1366 / Fx l1 / Sio-4) TaxID=880071 RepID=I4AQY1_BERLS|nr:N-acetylornithine carbamoyltransferase [Bernardetia litoralis]AFM06366.1 ornithine carbamoyltransferase [Bernardetia litoralis DSM 6794]